MRKILMGTTAVVGLALVAQAANAQTSFTNPVAITGAGVPGAAGRPEMPSTPATSGLTVRLGGFFDFSYGYVMQDSADKAYYRNAQGAVAATSTNFVTVPTNAVAGVYNTAATTVNTAHGRQKGDFRTEAELNIYVDGRAANGMQYGVVLEMQMDNLVTNAGSGTGIDFDEMYGFVKGSWGELRFGQEDNAANLLQVRRPGTLWMGSDDAWDEFTANTVSGVPYIMSGLGDGGDATKIIYLSPQFMGFDFGVSYAPNGGEGENFVNASSTTAFQRDFTGLTDELTAALRYRGTLGPVGVSASLAGYSAQSGRQSASGVPVVTRSQNVGAYSAGLNLAAYGFTVGGEYTWGNYIGRPGLAAAPKGYDGSQHYVLGAVYTIGNLSIGAQYGQGQQDNGGSTPDRTQTYTGFGASYVIAPGMTMFANYNKIQDENVPQLGQAGSYTASTAALTRAQFSTTSNTRDIQVLVAGVRVAF